MNAGLHSGRTMKQMLRSLLLRLANRFQLVRSVASLIHNSTQQAGTARDSYGYFRRKFIQNGKGSSIGATTRAEIAARFELIDRSVPIGTTSTEGLVLAELLINCTGAGEVVECGCYAGGSSAKLSIVASLLGKHLFVFDSFEGERWSCPSI